MPVLDAVLERFMAAGPDLADQDLAAIYELTTLRGLNRRRAALSSASSGTAATVEVRAAEVVARAIARACGTRASGDRWCLRRPLGPDRVARIKPSIVPRSVAERSGFALDVQLLVLSCDHARAIAYQPSLAQPREAATRAVEHDERGVCVLAADREPTRLCLD